MNNNNSNHDWVSANLQRQRKILEEKQRQRRMQSTILSNVGQNGSNCGIKGVSSGLQSDERDVWPGLGSEVPRSESSRDLSRTTGHTSNGRPSIENALLRNSLYSLSDLQRSTAKSDASNGQASTSDTIKVPPKIITVKGFTPPQSRKQSPPTDASKQLNRLSMNGSNYSLSNNTNGKMSQEPLANLGRRNTDSTALMNSEATHSQPSTSIASNNAENQCNLRHTNRREAWEEYDEELRLKQMQIASSTEQLSDKHVNPTMQDDEDAIPTEVVNEENPIAVSDIINNLDSFVMQPTRKNMTLKCKITRDKKGVDKGMFPIYYLHIERVGNRRIFLLAARRRKKSATANYLISTDPTDLSRNGKSFIAKIRSNAVGTAFTIYDRGDNPKKASVIGDGIRKELAAVIYETNVLGLKGPRKMIIIIPGIFVDEQHSVVRPLTVRPISEKDTILERYRTHRLDEMVVLYNKQPIWSEAKNTNGSLPNAQSNFVSEEQNEYIVMQFGRIDNDNFTMDVRYPLSPVQAFAIAMTSFHKKLACD